MPSVSIVLPTYNGQKYLRRALESILAQDYADWELIAVDDGSSDDTPTILADYAARDARIRVHRNNPNRKLPASLNIGFGLACGDYLTWTSDDNEYRPHAIGRLLAALQAAPDCDVAYSACSVVDDSGTFIKPHHALAMRALTHKNVVGASFLYRRRVQEALDGYDENLFLVEDYDFWLRASVQFGMVAVPDDLYLYRMHPGSLTSQRRRAIAEAREALLARMLPILPWATRKDKMEGYALLAREAREFAPQRARAYARRAWLLAPHVMARRALYRPLQALLRKIR